MLAVEEAIDRILRVIPVLGVETVSLPEALGRVLAEPVLATRDLPPWDNSSMDGYALRAADVGAARPDDPVRLRVVGEVPAGTVAPRPLAAGEVYRVLTGAPIPAGADAVAPQEDVERDGDWLRVSRPVAPAAYVRPRGEDVRGGDRLLEPGLTLGPAALGVLAAVGRPTVRVYQRPRVALLSTGDELVDLNGELGPGQIPNSNTYSLAAQVQAAGGVPVNLGIARDRLEEIEERLRGGLTADILVSSAGVSVGDRDFVREALSRLGAHLDFWKVSMRPGKPITFGTIGSRPVFGLPGNPVSCMVTFELFVRPALRRMAGHLLLHRPHVRARAVEALDNPGPRRAYLRVRLTGALDRLEARPTGGQGSAILRSMLLADGLAVVPPDTRVEPGEAVDVLLLHVEALGGPGR
ncbi:MAG: molybdopterin molybdenumtransferase MoeA [Candidatus Rokuibacteriota bacterium]|nr:MAG: molybdopterin molybdenumtransferase MoeA [Candidatus Rokubacteria bacterium]